MALTPRPMPRGSDAHAVLAMKLAEARHLANIRTQEPILLLDDVLSELDFRPAQPRVDKGHPV